MNHLLSSLILILLSWFHHAGSDHVAGLRFVVGTRVWSNITRAWTAELGRRLVGFVPSFRWVLPNPWTGSRPLVPTPVETEEVITPEECCFSFNKQRLALSQLMARGRGTASSCGHRTADNRICNMKNVAAPHLEYFWILIMENMTCYKSVKWGLFMHGIHCSVTWPLRHWECFCLSLLWAGW